MGEIWNRKYIYQKEEEEYKKLSVSLYETVSFLMQN